MPNSQTEFPLTLAEVLFAELYGDPAKQTPRSAGALLDEKIKANRKIINPQINLVERAGSMPRSRRIGRRERKPATKLFLIFIRRSTSSLFKSRPGRVPLFVCLVAAFAAPRSISACCRGWRETGSWGEFNYLSTVSGGGFIGSWLTAWTSSRRGPKLSESWAALGR